MQVVHTLDVRCVIEEVHHLEDVPASVSIVCGSDLVKCDALDHVSPSLMPLHVCCCTLQALHCIETLPDPAALIFLQADIHDCCAICCMHCTCWAEKLQKV